MKHMRVKDLIKKLEKCDPDAKVIIFNDDMYNNGMYYVTECRKWESIGSDNEESQVELVSNHKSIASGWDEE